MIFQLENWDLTLAFVVVASARAIDREERDLAGSLPGYASFAAATPRFLPRMRGWCARSKGR
jgi:protein-S-isoprenylcysteine O-methyltransferase Ste14